MKKKVKKSESKITGCFFSSESGIPESINVIDKAFVPLVKIIDKDTKICLDISFNTVQAVRAAQFITAMMARYPVLEPLVLVLKQFLLQRQLNQVLFLEICLLSVKNN
ncbi:unnamed protein product [Gongylonema pulchrum]|uniref:Poly(A) RNA polymerase mitochondrial-like central palm domain-containing protein n=1 Tax=Gongylonema pulchrum TaxID=637853 RepID=A0A183DM53_9BILA|nr:unnamed protein product [Gongylonema pulchrum]